jgi:hypothetical protein
MGTNGYRDWEEDGDSYPNLRAALAPEYAEMEPEALETLFETTYGLGISPDDMESIFGSIGDFAKNAAQTIGHVAQNAAPSILGTLGGAAQGAMSGAALGPIGMIGGAVLGGAGSALAKQGKGPLRDIGQALNTGLGAVGAFSPTGALGRGLLGAVSGGKGIGGLASGVLGALGGGGGLGTLGKIAGAVPGMQQGVPAAGQFLQLLSRPEVLQALQAMLLSPLGRPSVPVAGTAVPVDGFTNLLGMLAQQAQTEFRAAGGPQPAGMPEYLVESTGEYRCDPADPAQRAEVLWELLQSSEANSIEDEAEWEPDEAVENDAEAAFYDSIELDEINAEYEEAFYG